MKILVSVVIPTFQRTQLLRRCIDALTQQTFDRRAYEVIIVDDEASEKTKRLIQEYADCPDLPVIRYLPMLFHSGPAAARNCGWRAARGGIIAFTDDDCIPEPDWLSAGTDSFRDDVAGISGRIIVPVGNSPTDHERNTARLERSEFVTANCFYRKKTLEEVGGFDERFTLAWREDADLFFTLLKLNKLLVRAPGAIVVHPVREGRWGMSVREQSKSIFNALLYKKHPDLYKKKIQSPVLPHYYWIIASASACGTGLLLNAPHLALIAAVAWITITIVLSAKRLGGTSHSMRHVAEMIATSMVIPFLSVYWRVAGAFKFNVFFY